MMLSAETLSSRLSCTESHKHAGVMSSELIVGENLKSMVFVNHSMKVIIAEKCTFHGFCPQNWRWRVPAEQLSLSQDPCCVKIISEAWWCFLVLLWEINSSDIDPIEQIWMSWSGNFELTNPLFPYQDNYVAFACTYRPTSDIYRDLYNQRHDGFQIFYKPKVEYQSIKKVVFFHLYWSWGILKCYSIIKILCVAVGVFFSLWYIITVYGWSLFELYLSDGVTTKFQYALEIIMNNCC